MEHMFDLLKLRKINNLLFLSARILFLCGYYFIARIAQSEYRLAAVSDSQLFNLGSRNKTCCSPKPYTGSGAQPASYSMDNGVISRM